MNKKLLMILEVPLTIISMFALVACGGVGDNKTTNPNQLAVVQNVKYDEDNYKFTWDDVTNADSYNIKINADYTKEDIPSNEYNYYPKDGKSMTVQVQAVDSTGEYKASEWSDEYNYTIQAQDALVPSIMEFAKTQIGASVLKKFVSANAYKDRLDNSNGLILNLITEFEGKEEFTNINYYLDDSVDVSSLSSIIKANPNNSVVESYELAVDENGKAYNSMEYILQSDMSRSSLYRLYVNKGYGVEVISSYTALDKYDTKGKDFTVHGVLKLTRGEEVKYVRVVYDCSISDPSSLKNNVTEKLKTNRSYEQYLVEIGGDFAEAALEVRNVNKSNVQTTSYNAPSYYSIKDEGMSY